MYDDQDDNTGTEQEKIERDIEEGFASWKELDNTVETFNNHCDDLIARLHYAHDSAQTDVVCALATFNTIKK